MSIDSKTVNQYINRFASLIEEKRVREYSGDLKIGVDLGTANIVLAVLDEENEPVAGSLYPASVVKDGLVVDYIGAVEIVRELKKQTEELLGSPLTHAATAVPPGTFGKNKQAMANVVEAADMEVRHMIDEPTAAAAALGVADGAIVDIGGGTTGISILKEGEVIHTADEPTGGTHMTLTYAGHHRIPFAEADKRKRDPKRQDEVFPIIQPVMEKMAAITKRLIGDYHVDQLYLVGGASCFDGAERIFEKETGIETIKPAHPLLITPLGIALHDG
ncbi:ethanolamine utilization protein EutJ [Bacillus piscicola]|uniref:ethanolamine utilization protein EutJ n=1 Tax=Bacillus piscicola TaxID=1632684 RepID=UPI001F09940B|nr:ethanolamine utilization protein EutJ [Bacillus piscicola]